MEKKLKLGQGNWVCGERFFNREAEIEHLTQRFEEGGHTLLTAQRRMGKTSLIRELGLRLSESKKAIVIFIDLEKAQDAPDAIKELSLATHEHQAIWGQTKEVFNNVLTTFGNTIESINLNELGITLRAGLNPGNWQDKGDQIFEMLATQDLPVLLLIDELPILINRMLKGHDYQITPERRGNVDSFMSWLRHNAQTHKDNIRLVLSGSIGLEPVLRQAQLSATANIFVPYELKPWSVDTAKRCLLALSNNYNLNLTDDVLNRACDLLGCCIPHHVQMLFTHLYETARHEHENDISVAFVEKIYREELLSVRGHAELTHYEERLRLVLGGKDVTLAFELLTETAVSGRLTPQALQKFATVYQEEESNTENVLKEILWVLEHDGYLKPVSGNFIFVSNLLKDWWKARHSHFYTPISNR